MRLPAIFFTAFALVLVLSPASFAQSQELKWEKVDVRGGEVAEIAISPLNPDIMYAGFEANAHALYKSTDGGKSWIRISGPGDHAKDVAVSPADPNKAYVAMSESVHTTDLSIKPKSKSRFDSPFAMGGGSRQTQTVLSSGIEPGPSNWSFSSFEIFDGNDKIMYAALKGGGFGLFSGGADPPHLYKSTDGGVSWDTNVPDLIEANVLEIHPKDANVIFIGSRDGIYKTSDLGKNMEKILSGERIISIEIQKDNPDILYASSLDTVYKSDNNGEKWQEITSALKGKKIHRVRIARSKPDILYAATFDGIFKSDNGGKSWKDVSSNLKAKNFQIVSIHPQNPDIAYAGTSTLWSSVRNENEWKDGLYAQQGIFKTTDGGDSWQRSDDGIFEYDIEEVAVNPTKEYEAWFAASASRGAYKTEDGGQTWRVFQSQTAHYPMRIKYSFQDPSKVFMTSWHNGGPLAFSYDGGINWTILSESIFFEGINSGKQLLSPSQGGAAIHVHGLAVDPENEQILYAGSVHDAQNPSNFPLHGAHIFKSEDGGQSWSESDKGFPHEAEVAIHDMLVDPTNSNIVYAATTKDEARVGRGIYKSEDAGGNWQAVNNGLDDLNTWAIVASPKQQGMLIVAGDGGLYKSGNGGKNWKKTLGTPSQDVEFVADQPDIVYASTVDGVYKSRDFGSSWYKVSSSLPEGEGQGIGVDKGGNVVYTAIKNHGLFVARLTNIEQKDLPTQTGKGRGFGMENFGPPGFSKSAAWPVVITGLGLLGALLLAGLIGVIIWKKRNLSIEKKEGIRDDFDV